MTDGSMMGGAMAAERNPNYQPATSGTRSKFNNFQLLWCVAVLFQTVYAFETLGVWERFFGISFNSTTLISAQLIAYTFLSIWAFFAFKDRGIISKGDIERLLFFLAVSVIYVIIIPSYSYLLGNQSFLGLPPTSSWLKFIFYVVIPIWPLYIAKHSGDEQLQTYTHRYINIWIFILLVIFIFNFATTVTAADVASIGGRPESVEAATVLDFLMEKGNEIVVNTKKALNPAVLVGSIVNATGIKYYTGTVDQNEKAPVGLYIDNVRTQDRFFYTGSPAVVWADIRGKSFTEEMHITPYCYTDGAGNKRTDGEPFPQSLEIFGEEHDSIRCTFNDLPKGTYNAKVGASFNFETWAYVTYTFVDLELQRSMTIENKDINHELDISRNAQSVYTNGPMMLGMNSMVDQPIGVDKVNNNRDAVLGFTLQNRWSEGGQDPERKAIEFTLQIPDDIQLLDCDRWLPDKSRAPSESKDGYDTYTFTRDELLDPRIEFLSLTCRIHVKDPQTFLAGQQKVQRTFVSQAKYYYNIQKSIGFTVKE